MHTRFQAGLLLAIGITAIAFLLSFAFNVKKEPNSFWLCQFQGFFVDFSGWLTMLYSLVFAIWLLVWITCGRELKICHWAVPIGLEIGTHLFVWVVSIIASTIPFSTNSYGVAGDWCFLNGSQDAGKVYLTALFYGPMWFCMLLVFIIYTITLILVFRSYNKHRMIQGRSFFEEFKSCFGGYNSLDKKSSFRQWIYEMRVYLKLILTPCMFCNNFFWWIWVVIFLIIATFPTVNRIQFLFTQKNYLWIGILHIISVPMYAVLIVIIHFANPLVGSSFVWSLLCCKVCSKKQKESIEFQEIPQTPTSP